METDLESGQALVEFAAATLVLVAVLVACVALFRAEWNRGRCAYRVFEAVHARLMGRALSLNPPEVSLIESSESVRGEGRCGEAREEVELPRLESARW